MMKNDPRLKRIKDLAKKAREIHPLFARLYPLAISQDKKLYIYRVSGNKYLLYKVVKAPEWLPEDVMAAFPLEENDYEITCVVSSKALEGLEGLVLVLHEFVHCYQFETCEHRLKKTLSIARKYEDIGVYDWELTHPFPYDNTEFIEAYTTLLQDTLDVDKAKAARRKLKKTLSTLDYEYMVWVEWKEGFARYLENKIRRTLNLPENHLGRDKPYTRLTLYEGGAKLTEILVDAHKDLYLDIERLFTKIKNL